MDLTFLTLATNVAGWDAAISTNFDTLDDWLTGQPLFVKNYTTGTLPAAASYQYGAVWDTTTGTLKISDGASWLTLSGPGSFASQSANRVFAGPTSGGAAAPAFRALVIADLPFDADGTLAANSDAVVPTQKAVKTYVATAVTGLLEFKGSTDCSANPNYPAASKGDAYVVSVAGKIGGGSGTSVDAGDVYAASADNAGGTEASVGTSWFKLEHNLTGALLSANNLSDVANAGTARTNLGLAIGTNVQAYDAELAALAGLTSAADKLAYFTGSGTAALTDLTSAGRSLIDDATVADMRTTLGVSTIGNTGAISDSTGTLAVARGGTGLTTFGAANTVLYTTAADALDKVAVNSTATKKYLQQYSSGAPAMAQVDQLHLSGQAGFVLTASLTNNTNSLADATGFTVPIGANETWVVDIDVYATCSGVGGMNFAATVPASGTLFAMGILGISSSATTLANELVTTGGTASSRPWNASSSVTGVTKIRINVINGANAGNIQLQWKSVTNGQTSTILLGSSLTAQRTA